MIDNEIVNFIRSNTKLLNRENLDDFYEAFSNSMGPFYVASDLTEAFLELGIDPMVRLENIPTHYYWCVEREYINISTTIKSISEEGLARTKLESIVIPENVEEIHRRAFQFNDRLTELIIESPKIKIFPTEAAKGCGSLTRVLLNKGLTAIGDSAFEDCFSLNMILIPDGVTHIHSNAFYQCESLWNVSFPKSIQFAGSNLFKRCDKLKSISFRGSMTDFRNSFLNTDHYWMRGSNITKVLCSDGTIDIEY